MIPITEERNVTSTVVGETQQYTIRATGKSFKILLDNLYAEKPLAVVRELWTNAYDSHVAAGHPELPFVCQLPTALDPQFKVRDFGVSMDHNTIMTLYTTLFHSSKEGTNDEVGQLGLGSKSPFAYTDTFTVTAWLNGEERIYLATIAGDGVPTITHLNTTPSDEPTGIEVSLPVQEKDFGTFIRAAERCLMGFDVAPIIRGSSATKPEPLMSGGNWQIYQGHADYGIRQGCVVYHVNRWGGYYDYAQMSGNVYMVVDVPIGSVDITPSREALSMDDRTAEVVRNAIAAALEDVKSDIQGNIEKCATRLEAQRLAAKYQTIFTRQPEMTWRGQTLGNRVDFVWDYLNGYKGDQNEMRLIAQRLKASGWKADWVPPVYLKVNDEEAGTSFSINDLDSLVFVIDRGQEMPRKIRRLQSFLKQSNHLLVKNPTNSQLRRLVRRLDLRKDQLVSVTSLPDVIIAKRAPRAPGAPKTITGAWQVNGWYTNPFSKITELPDDYLWLEANRPSKGTYFGVAGMSVAVSNLCDFQETVLKLTQSSDEAKPIVLFNKTAAKKADPQLNFAVRMKELLEDREGALAELGTAVYMAYNASYISRDLADYLFEDFGNNGSWRELRYQQVLQKYINTDENEKLFEKFQAKYPLIFNPTKEAIKEYIQAVDKNGS